MWPGARPCVPTPCALLAGWFPDAGVGLEGGPSEPEDDGVGEGGEGLAGEGAGDGGAGDVPGGAGFGVDELVLFGSKGEGLAVDLTGKDSRLADIAGGGDLAAIERRAGTAGVEDGDGLAVELVVDGAGFDQGGERVGCRVIAQGEADDAFHRGQTLIGFAVEEEGRAVDVIVAGVGVLAVGTVDAGGATEDVGVRVGTFEGGPAEDLGRDGREDGTGQLADDRLAGELLPPGFGLAVPHHEVAQAEIAGGAEIIDNAIWL